MLEGVNYHADREKATPLSKQRLSSSRAHLRHNEMPVSPVLTLLNC